LGETVIITVRPKEVAPSILDMMDLGVAIGLNPKDTLSDLASHSRGKLDDGFGEPYAPGRDAVLWDLKKAEGRPQRVEMVRGSIERFRHHRKYAEGDLADKSFYFEGPERALKLKAQNLALFVQIGQGIDEATWLYHLRRHDYSKWLRECVKDGELAELVEGIERRPDLSAAESKVLICNLIDRRYTLR
jgi:hypothetical protein